MNNTKIVEYYKKKLSAVNAELLTLPEGCLVIRGTRYYHVVDGKTIGITKNTSLVRLLYRKKYLLSFKKMLDKNISIISKPASKLHALTHEEIIRTLPASFQEAPSSHFLHSSIEPWLAKSYQKNSYAGRKLETKNGIEVRSKSELMIANLLEDYNIPYHYEAAFTLAGQTKYPDFIIKQPFDGKLIIWEHFGALHLPKYEETMNDKMELYLANNFIPFETIIYTFEFDMNTRRLKNLIENIILA